jgi:O-antigen/teichoic acid export membrane protein
LIERLASLSAVGYAEAARIAAHPILVLAFGLSAVLGPRSMEASAAADKGRADRVQRILGLSLLISTVLYGVIAGPAGWWNPMTVLVPNAYEIPGLVAVSLLANLAIGWFYARDAEFMGAHRERDLLRIEAAASPVAVLVALTASVTGPFARPLGQLGMGLTRIGVSIPRRNAIYESQPDVDLELVETEELGPVLDS